MPKRNDIVDTFYLFYIVHLLQQTFTQNTVLFAQFFYGLFLKDIALAFVFQVLCKVLVGLFDRINDTQKGTCDTLIIS